MTPRGALTRRLLAALLALTAAGAIIGAVQPPGRARARVPAAALGTPLWSVRRTPQMLVDAVGVQHLRATLAAQTGPNRACFVVRDATAGGAVLGELAATNPDDGLIPASTLKLLTATAALDLLGASFHFTTAVQGSTAPSAGLVDRLYLVGHGDALLSTPERIARDQKDPKAAGLPSTPLATLADRIKAAGVTFVPGGIVGVDGRYDRTRYSDEWDASTRAAIGPIGALTVNDGFTGAAGMGVVASDPALNAAVELTRLLVARGVGVGAPSLGEVPAGAPDIASIESAALPLVLVEMLSASDNLTAEMLTRELGARVGVGTTAKGVAEVVATMTRLGIPMTGVIMHDGSGLSRNNAVPCRTLLAILLLTGEPRFAPIRDGLAVAGRRGTLADRLVNTPLAGNLRAKTGTLNGVSALAGFVTSDRPLTFSILLNGTFGEATGTARRESMATTLAGFPQTTAGAALVPVPNAPIPSRACPNAEPAC